MVTNSPSNKTQEFTKSMNEYNVHIRNGWYIKLTNYKRFFYSN